MTPEQLGQFVIEIYTQDPPDHLRRGQWAYNLYRARYKNMPDVTNMKCDPFYKDENLGLFFEFISKHVTCE